jgi:cation diffusion facilitator family transporter
MSDKHKEGSHEGASVLSALGANVAVSVVKFVAYLVSGSVAMASESVHGLADCTSEICLIMGKRLADRQPTRRHPLGFGRARYLAAFIVSVFMFSLGGIFAIGNAYGKVKSVLDGGPAAHSVDTGHLLMVLVVCVIAAMCEGWSLRQSVREAKGRYKTTGHPGEFSLVRFWFGTKSADIVSVVAEDTLALTGLAISAIGVIMAIITGDDIWDAFAGLLVGVLLVIGAVLLGIQTASLIIGEGASDTTYDRIDRVLAEDDGIEKVLREPIAVHISDNKLLLLLKVQVRNDEHVDDAIVINRVEDKIRKSLPWYDLEIFVEPDDYDASIADKREYAPSMFPDNQTD